MIRLFKRFIDSSNIFIIKLLRKFKNLLFESINIRMIKNFFIYRKKQQKKVCHKVIKRFSNSKDFCCHKFLFFKCASHVVSHCDLIFLLDITK